MARYFLPLELFKEIKLPKNENFSKFYAKRLFQNEIPKPKLYFTFPPELELINVILSAPVAKTLVYQPHLPSDKTFFLDHKIRGIKVEFINFWLIFTPYNQQSSINLLQKSAFWSYQILER